MSVRNEGSVGVELSTVGNKGKYSPTARDNVWMLTKLPLLKMIGSTSRLKRHFLGLGRSPPLSYL